MSRALYTAATGMIAQQMNVDNIANNLANVNTCRLPQPLRRIGGVIPGLFNGGRWKSGASSAGKSRPRGTPAGVAPPYSSTWARASSRFSMKYWMVSGSARAGSFWAISSSLS